MKEVTLSELERNLDSVLDDVIDNSEHYIVNVKFCLANGKWENKSLVLIPEQDYEILKETYDESFNMATNFDFK